MRHVDVLHEARVRCGESPLWDPETARIFWVDILTASLFVTDLDTGVTTSTQLPLSTLGAVALSQDGDLVVAADQGFGHWTANGGYEGDQVVLPPGQRMNDAKVAPDGSLWAGSTAMDFTVGAGGLWRTGQPDRAAVSLVRGLVLPNGLGWSPDAASFYLVDSMARLVLTARWDGQLHGPLRVLADLHHLQGIPDGMCVDAEGDLWIAMYGGGALVRLTPNGEVREELSLPTRQPTSCAFVGPRLDQLVVTSAADGLADPHRFFDGSLLRVTGLDTAGVPAARFTTHSTTTA